MSSFQQQQQESPPPSPSNPHGLGDPADLTLRKVEHEIMIPMKMRDKAKQQKCQDLVSSFHDCCVQHGVLMVVRCRAENTAMRACLTRWYQDPQFKAECTREYLDERSEYRRTGVKKGKEKKWTN